MDNSPLPAPPVISFFLPLDSPLVLPSLHRVVGRTDDRERRFWALKSQKSLIQSNLSKDTPEMRTPL